MAPQTSYSTSASLHYSPSEVRDTESTMESLFIRYRSSLSDNSSKSDSLRLSNFGPWWSSHFIRTAPDFGLEQHSDGQGVDGHDSWTVWWNVMFLSALIIERCPAVLACTLLCYDAGAGRVCHTCLLLKIFIFFFWSSLVTVWIKASRKHKVHWEMFYSPSGPCLCCFQCIILHFMDLSCCQFTW